jgi:hypothetical protein
MSKKIFRSFGIAALGLAAAIAGPVAQADHGDQSAQTDRAAQVSEAHPTSVKNLDAEPLTKAEFQKLAAAKSDVTDAPLLGWDVPWAMSYTILSSCSADAGSIRQGAAAWNQLSEGGGTPVECRSDYITDCGGGQFVVGCNWGSGQRIALFPGGVNDDALLAAHEFGHDWYGHSSYQCAGWGSPAEVMAPSICNLAAEKAKM